MNSVEVAWVIMQLMALAISLQKIKTLDVTCSQVANNPRSRHVLDSKHFAEQNYYGMS